MKILLVCNNAFLKGNGLCTAIQNLSERLTEAGQEVRIISVKNEFNDYPQPFYQLEHFKFPIFEPIIYANGFCYAKIDKKILTEAISWADVVHLEDAFFLPAVAADIAAKLGKPCVSSFHLFAENIMANLGMGVKSPLNDIVTWAWKKTVFDKCSDIHCPSPVVRDFLERKGFRSRLHVFTNGMASTQRVSSLEKPQDEPYLILCTGRFANEKSQMTLLNAMRYSRHAKDIQLSFAGKGPKEKKYKKAASQLVKDGILKHNPTFGFYTHEELDALAGKAYLYIHCAWVEVEGLSCLEAIKEGAVPIVAEGPFVATSQFALDDRSKFPEKDSHALAERIDWWIEHPEERIKMGRKYMESVKAYSADYSTEQMIAMYRKAMGQ